MGQQPGVVSRVRDSHGLGKVAARDGGDGGGRLSAVVAAPHVRCIVFGYHDKKKSRIFTTVKDYSFCFNNKKKVKLYLAREYRIRNI